jgi:hypothetical protein
MHSFVCSYFYVLWQLICIPPDGNKMIEGYKLSSHGYMASGKEKQVLPSQKIF